MSNNSVGTSRRNRIKRQECMDKGICFRCKKKKEDKTKIRCESCLKLYRDYNKNRRKKQNG